MGDNVLSGTDKIDSLAVDGLLGAADSLAYKITEIERHFHSGGRWFGATAAAGVGPGLLTSLLPFKVIASDTQYTYGDAIVVLDGTEGYDSPLTAVKQDPHRIFVTAAGKSALIWKVRFANSQWNGAGHTYANIGEAVTAKKYSEFLIKIDNTKSDATSVKVQTGRLNVGSILWAQVMNDSSAADNEAERTLSFLIGTHTYEG